MNPAKLDTYNVIFFIFLLLRQLPKNQKYGFAAPLSTKSINMGSVKFPPVFNLLHSRHREKLWAYQ